MKNILCFGDSNTYGESPEGVGRYERHERWTGMLQQLLGDDYLVIEEGLNGRTTVWEDPVELEKSGLKHLPCCLLSHAPLDLVIMMLGTNDLKRRFSVTATDISIGAEQLVKAVRRSENGRRLDPPAILLAAPIAISRTTFLGEVFGDRHDDSLRLGNLYRDVASRNNAEYISIAEIASPSPLDGLHLDREGHKNVAHALHKKVLEILSK